MYENEPRSVGGVLDAGIRLYRAAFSRVTRTAAAGFGAVFALEAGFEFGFGISSGSLNTAGPQAALPEDLTIYFGLLLPLTLLVSLVTTAAVALQLHRVASVAPETAAGLWSAALRRVPAFLGVLVLYGLLVVVGVILLLIPGIWLSVALAPAMYFVFTEGRGPIAALGRSFEVVRGNWWRSATVVLVATFIVAVIETGIVSVPAVIAVALATAGDGEIGALWVLALNLLDALAQAVAIPVTLAMGLALVRDLALRASGEDLESRLDAVEA